MDFNKGRPHVENRPIPLHVTSLPNVTMNPTIRLMVKVLLLAHAMKAYKCEGTVHPTTGHAGTKEGHVYSSTLSLTSTLDRGGWSKLSPSRFSPIKRPGTRCTRGWVDLGAGPEGHGKSGPPRGSNHVSPYP